MDVARFERLCRQLGFDAESRRVLRGACPSIEPRLGGVVDELFAAIRDEPSLHELIGRAAERDARVKTVLRSWLEGFWLGPRDARYLEARSQLGRRLLRWKLPQELAFATVSRLRSLLGPLAESASDDPRGRTAIVLAANKALDVELAIVLDAYCERLKERVRSGERVAAELLHHRIIEALPAFVIVIDESGHILFWNSRLEEVTGFGREEMIGRDVRQIAALDGDSKLPLKSGGHRLVRWQLRQVPGPADSTISYAFGIDVTAERDALRRTLQNERLAAVGTLAAGLAHELNNPLNSAALQLKVLEGRLGRGETDASALRAVLSLVQDEVSRIGRLIKDFLAFAQPQALKLERVDLNGLLTRAAEDLRCELAGSEIRLEAELDPAVGLVELDSERVRQLVGNLLANAVEALGGHGNIWLKSHGADAGGFVEVVVEDSGPGFSPTSPIFDAFYTTKPSGTGLGLAIGHRIAGDHGGSLRGASQNGRTAFTLRLPQHSR